MKKIYELTKEGIEELQIELVHFKDVRRVENLADLKEAREQGDLSENADYDAARTEQARIEARISEIENILKNVKEIKSTDDEIVSIGKKVVIKFLDKNTVQEYRLVGTIEANPLQYRISIDSPLGKSIRDHEKGDVVTVKSETGKVFDVEIVSVS